MFVAAIDLAFLNFNEVLLLLLIQYICPKNSIPNATSIYFFDTY